MNWCPDEYITWGLMQKMWGRRTELGMGSGWDGSELRKAPSEGTGCRAPATGAGELGQCAGQGRPGHLGL